MNNQTALLIPDPQQAMQPITPLSMIQLALQQNAPVEVLRDLFKLKQEVDADEARKAFYAAMAEFKRNPPRITKNKHVKVNFKEGGGMEYDHATLDEVVDAIGPALSKVGVRHSWVPTQESGRITVTCTLSHCMGYSESVTLSAPPDMSGKKNPIQSEMSTVTYLERYTLLAATGMAAAGIDTDGRAPQRGGLPDEEFIPHQEAIQYARDMNELKAAFKKAYTMAITADDQRKFTALYEARKKAMQ